MGRGVLGGCTLPSCVSAQVCQVPAQGIRDRGRGDLEVVLPIGQNADAIKVAREIKHGDGADDDDDYDGDADDGW